MKMVKTIRKASSLVLAMRAAGGIHVRTALLRAAEAVRGARAENLRAQADLLAQMQTWRAQDHPSEADWQDLYDSSSGLISVCDPQEDIHLLRCARLLCEYVSRTSAKDRRKAVGDLFISTLSALGDQSTRAEVRAQVLAAFEALIPRR